MHPGVAGPVLPATSIPPSTSSVPVAISTSGCGPEADSVAPASIVIVVAISGQPIIGVLPAISRPQLSPEPPVIVSNCVFELIVMADPIATGHRLTPRPRSEPTQLGSVIVSRCCASLAGASATGAGASIV